MSNKVTGRNFTKTLTSVAAVYGTVRDGLQALLVFAIAQANKGNLTFINQIGQSKSFKGLSMNSVKIYIEAHADVKFALVDGVNVFGSQKTRGYTAPPLSSKTWYEFTGGDEMTVVVPVTMLQSLIKRLEGAIGGEGKTSVAKKHQKGAKAMLVQLKVAEAKAA